LVEISLTSVVERDIDLLLLEEFAANQQFALWFARNCNLNSLGDKPVLRVSHSVTRSSGESDLEVAFLLNDKSVWYLLIENKVVAGFQPRQAERYRERGDFYVKNGECTGYTSVLLAPKAYLGSDCERFGFDYCVTYESIAAWLGDRCGTDIRVISKQAVLSRAIEKSKLGYIPIKDHPVTKFWHSYWELSSKIAPELQMPEPDHKPSGAGFIYFRPLELPKEIKLVHKLSYGNVDLQFSGMGSQLAEFSKNVKHHVKPDMRVRPANKSGVVRLKVPVLVTTDAFTAQQDSALEGIEAARRLLQWYIKTAL
jgi:hypothetical protein